MKHSIFQAFSPNKQKISADPDKRSSVWENLVSPYTDTSIHRYTCTNDPMKQWTKTSIHQYTDTSILWCTDTSIHRYTYTNEPMTQWTNEHHRYTDTPIHRYSDTDAPIHRCIDVSMIHQYNDTSMHGYIQQYSDAPIHRYKIHQDADEPAH